MKVSICKICVVLAILINIGKAITALRLLKNNTNYEFTVFIGIKIPHDGSFTREVVGIGAIVGKGHVLTTEEYMKWYDDKKFNCFIYVGSHDFDQGGKEFAIEDIRKPPQQPRAGRHTFVLLVFHAELSPVDYIVPLDGQFLAAGTKVEMIGIYEHEQIQIEVSDEVILSNKYCASILKVDPTYDDQFNNFGSHMCLESTNMERTDCKSHIGTFTVMRIAGFPTLTGIKSELHQSCSRVPYIIKFQRTAPIAQWVKNTIRE